MTDRELLEAAAKAAGVPLKPDFAERFDYYMADPMMWNPLQNDGDALRLAVKLNIWPVRKYERPAIVVQAGEAYFIELAEEPIGGDPCAATRRAVVRAAAAMAKEKAE